MSLVNQMFGVAAAAAWSRCGGSGETTKNVLAALAKGFGGSSGDGIYVHNLLASKTGTFTNCGFDGGSLYTSSLEASVQVFQNDYRIGVAAIVYAYANYPKIETSKVVNYINDFASTFGVLNGVPETPKFSEDHLNYALANFSLPSINNQIGQCASGIIGKAINYNWYDAEPLFLNPNFNSMATLIRDTECQYYYVSGELLYPSVPKELTPCSSYDKIIQTPTGQFTMKVYENTPCVDKYSYIGPKSGIHFYRTFVDGPGTSGYFYPDVMEQYVEFEKATGKPEDYSLNLANLFTNKKDASGNYVSLRGNTRLDILGQHYSGREYGVGHTNWIDEECTNHPAWPLMRMHQGDAVKKWYFQSYINEEYECVYSSGQHDWTGWKFAPFKFKDSFAKEFVGIKVNPRQDSGKVLKRILNLDNYIDENSNSVSPYLHAADTGDGALTCGDLRYFNFDGHLKYVGPPQLHGNSSLPGLVFYQTFDSTNFPSGGEKASIVLRPAVGINNSSFEVSQYNLFSGLDAINHSAVSNTKAKVSFVKHISAQDMTGYDDAFRKCITIGDNFGNQATSTATQQANAGHLYSGYTYYINGIPVKPSQLLEYNAEKVGNQFSKIKYVKGYQSGQHKYFITDKYAYNITGDVTKTGEIVKYQYFSDNVLGAMNSGWEGEFAPVPTIVDEHIETFEPIYETQDVENYLPRYKTGPYLTYENKFLYPNAKKISDTYESRLQGFPLKVQYAITFKEETVREAYLVSGFYGLTRSRFIVRAKANEPHTLETKMTNPFVASNPAFSYKYDYLKNKELYPEEGEFYEYGYHENLVDENFVPSVSRCPQGHLHSQIFHSPSTNNSFARGIQVTGILNQRFLRTGVSGQGKQFNFIEPVGGGLYWGYKSRKITGEMLYTSPVFNLADYEVKPSENMKKSMFSEAQHFPNNDTSSHNGLVSNGSLYDNNTYLYNGVDPIYYQCVGGRSGIGAELEGGYHSKGIIGDAWYDVKFERWGSSYKYCSVYKYWYHYPPHDKYVTLADLTPTGLNLHVRGMYYYPYYLDWKYNPFKTSSIGQIGVDVTAVEALKQDFYFSFNLKPHFYPLKTGYSGLFSTSGLDIGPFNRDVELCITGVNSIIPSGYLIIDGVAATSPYIGCNNMVTDIALNSGIILGEAGRNGKISTFKLVPSGKKVNINVSGEGIGTVGISRNSIVTIRPRNSLGAVVIGGSEAAELSGDYGYMDSFRYIDNGSEVVIPFPNSSKFENLVGSKFSKTTEARIQVLYPVPESDFDAVLKPTLDAVGNKIYKQKNPTKEYWKIKDPAAMFTGFRDVTRVHVSIDSISVNNGIGEIPYQSYNTIVPSGECIISGVFGYTGQAESAVISDGIVLSGISGAAALSGRFEPVYVSEVLERIPSGIFVIPSGSGHKPILQAPTFMKTRKNVFAITGNDTYLPVYPDGSSNYNAFLWPAWSDLALLNPEVVYEQMPPADGNTFQGSYLTFSASQGQAIYTGQNPQENVTYAVVAQYAMIDSTATDAMHNTGKCILSGSVSKTMLNSGDLSGILTAEGNSLTMAIALNNFKK